MSPVPSLLAFVLLAPPPSAGPVPDHIDLLTRTENPGAVHLTPTRDGAYTVYWAEQDRSRPADPPSDSVGYDIYRGRLDRRGRLTAVKPVARRLTHVLARHGGRTLARQSRFVDMKRGWMTELVQWTDRRGKAANEIRVPLPPVAHLSGEQDTRAVWDPTRKAWAVTWGTQHRIAGHPLGYSLIRLRFGWLDPMGAWRDVGEIAREYTDGDRVTSPLGGPLIATPDGPVQMWAGPQLHITRLAKPSAPLLVSDRPGIWPGDLAVDARGVLGVAWTEALAEPPAGSPRPRAGVFRALRFARLDGETLTRLDPAPLHATHLHVASDGRGFLVAWTGASAGGQAAHIARVEAAGDATPGRPTPWTIRPEPLHVSRWGSNWVDGLSFDGRFYVVRVMHGLNPSQYRLYLLDPARRYSLPFVPPAGPKPSPARPVRALPDPVLPRRPRRPSLPDMP